MSTVQGSTLDLSNVRTFTSNSDGYGGPWAYWVTAKSNSTIDLSKVTTITGARTDGAGDNDDWLHFRMDSGGTIDLSKAAVTDGRVLCMDEQPVQLLKETRTPIPATAQHGKRVDYEYERAGTANIFMFTEPLAGWREAAVRETKNKLDKATETARLLEGRYVDCEKVILVCDNLNTHTKGAIYEAFEPERARQLVRRIEFRHTPKHGSWLNIAENELSLLTRQCVDGRRSAERSRRSRFGNVETLFEETTAWSSDV